MSKLALKNSLNRLRKLGHAPDGMVKPKGRSFRSGFQRSVGAMVFAFIYFVIASQLLDNGDASSNNDGIFILLFFALITASLGAFFAPRISAYIYSRSMVGRRHQADKSRRTVSSSSRSRSSGKRAPPELNKSPSQRQPEQ